MSFADLGALGELFGAIGVVISILYLSRQIRQNTDAVRSGNATTVQENFQRLARVFYTDREMGSLLLKAMAGDDLEDPSDRQAAFSPRFRKAMGEWLEVPALIEKPTVTTEIESASPAREAS